MDIPLPEECMAPPSGGGPLPQSIPPEFDIPLPSYSAQTNILPQQPPPLPMMKTVPPPLPGLVPGRSPQQHPAPPPQMQPTPPMQMRPALPPQLRPAPPPQLLPSASAQPMIGPPPHFLPTPPPQTIIGPPPPMLPALPQQPIGRPPSQLLPTPPPQPVSELPAQPLTTEKSSEQNDESNKYSPSHASIEDDVPSPSISKAQPPVKTSTVPRTTVLGKAQAKKRLLAFSMTKQGGGAGVSFGFAKKNATKVGNVTAKEFTGPAPEQQQQQQQPQQQPQQAAEEDKTAKPEKPSAATLPKKKANRKASAREDKARSVIAAIEEIKREELVMRGVLSFTSLDTKCTGDMTAPIPLPGQPYVPPPSHAPLRARELDMMTDLFTEKQRDKELLVEELLSRDLSSKSKDEKPRSESKSSREEKKETSRSRRDRSHSREKKRRSSKDRHGHSRKEKEEKRSRPTEMPTNWAQFLSQGYLFEEIRRIKAKLQDKLQKESSSHDRQKSRSSRDRRSRSREKKHRRSSPLHDSIKDKDMDEDGEMVYKVLSFPSKSLSPLYAVSIGQGTKAYPRIFVKTTKTRPLLTYCENPSSSTSYLKTRKEIFAESPLEVVKLMELIINGSGEKNVKKIDKNSNRTSDASLSNSLAALQVSYDEGELEENLSSDDMPAGKKRERLWFCSEKDWFSSHLDADVMDTNVNGVLMKEIDSTVKEKEELDDEADHSKEKKAVPEAANITTEKKYNSPVSDHKPENKRHSLSEPPVECIKVRSKWDSDYEEDAVSVENVSIAVSVQKTEENEFPCQKEDDEDVKIEQTPTLENELKTPENMDVSGESDTETSELHAVNNSLEDANTTVANNGDEESVCDGGLKEESNVSEQNVTSESEHIVESPKYEQPIHSPKGEADVSLNNSIASAAGNGSEKNTDLKLVSEYEEFMKAVSFDTCFAEESAVVSEEENISNVSDGVEGVENNDLEEKLSVGPKQDENEGKESITSINIEEKQNNAESTLIMSNLCVQSESIDSEYNDIVEETVNLSPNADILESKTDETDENNLHKNSHEVYEENISKLPDNEIQNLQSHSSSNSDLEQSEKETAENVQKEIITNEVVLQSDESGMEQSGIKISKPKKDVPKEIEEVTKVIEKSLKADGKKSNLRGKHLKRKRKYTKVKHSKKKTRRKRAESSSSESSSDSETSSSEEEKTVKHTKRRDRKNRPSVSSDDSSSDESTTSSSSSSSTPSSSSSSSNDRRSRKKKKKQRKKVKTKKNFKKGKKDKVNQRKKHRKRKLEDSESDYEGKSSKSSHRREEKQPRVENSTVSKSEEKIKRKHKTHEIIVDKTGSLDENIGATGQNSKDVQAKDDKTKPLENSVSISFEADDSSVESCWEASFKEKRAREKLKKERTKSSKVNAGSDDENENDRKVKRRRKEHRSRSSSPKKKRRRSPSSSPDNSPVPKARNSRDNKTRHRSRTDTDHDTRKLHHSSNREKKRNRKEECEERDHSKERKESSKRDKQGNDHSKGIKAHKRKKESRERREKRESSKPRDRKVRSKSKEKEKLKYSEKKDRSKSKEKRKDKRHKEKSSKHRYKGRELETSEDELQTRRKSFRSRYYRYRSKTKENSEKKKTNTEEEAEKKKHEKQRSKNEDSDINDSDNQETENEDSENEETGNEDSENGEDSENQGDSENKEDSENQNSENHESEEDDSENDGSDNQSTSNGGVDDTVGSVTDQFDLFREIKQEVFSDDDDDDDDDNDDVTSEPQQQGSFEGSKLLVCKEERIDSNEEVVNSVMNSDIDKNSAHELSHLCNGNSDPKPLHPMPVADTSEIINDVAAATSNESEDCFPNVESSLEPPLGNSTTDIPNESVFNTEQSHENSAHCEISVTAIATGTNQEDEMHDSEVQFCTSVTNLEVDQENSCSETSITPDVIMPKKSLPLISSASITDACQRNDPPLETSVATLVENSNEGQQNVRSETPVKDITKKSNSIVLYSPGDMDSDEDDDNDDEEKDDKSESANQLVMPQICKENSLSSDVEVPSRGHFDVCSDMSLDSEICQTKSMDSLSVKSNFEAPNISDSYTADFFCGSSWNSSTKLEEVNDVENSTFNIQKTSVSLENIPLPPPKISQETNLTPNVPIQAIPSSGVIQSNVNSKLLDTAYPFLERTQPLYPVVANIQPCPPPLPPIEATPKLRTTPKAPVQKHVITVKLLSSMTRQEAMSAATIASATSKVTSLMSKSNPKCSDKIEAVSSLFPTTIDTTSITSAGKNLASDVSPWKAFGSADSDNKLSLYDDFNPVDSDSQVSSLTVKSELVKDETEQVVVPTEQSADAYPAVVETPAKRVRKRPSRWGMTTPLAKDAYIVDFDKACLFSARDEVVSGEKRAGPIFQILSGEKTSAGSSSSIVTDIKKLEVGSSVSEENISEPTNSEVCNAFKPESKLLKTCTDVPKSIGVDVGKLLGDNLIKNNNCDGIGRECSKLKDCEGNRNEHVKLNENEKGSADGEKSRQKRDKDKDKRKDKGREKSNDRDKVKNKEREKRHRDRSREKEGYKLDCRDGRKASENRSVDTCSDYNQPASDRKEVLRDNDTRIKLPNIPSKSNISDSSHKPSQSEQEVAEHSDNCEQPQQLHPDNWGTWSASQSELKYTETDWEHRAVGHEYPVESELYPAKVQEDSWQSRVVTYQSRSPSPNSTWNKIEAKDFQKDSKRVNKEEAERTDSEIKWTKDVNNTTRDLFECQSKERSEENSWHGENRNDTWKRSCSRSPLARLRNPVRRRSHSSPRRSPSSSRRRSRSPSFSRTNLALRSSHSPSQSYSPFRRRSCSPYPQQIHSPASRRYSPISRSRSPAARQNYSPKRSRSRSSSLRRSPLPRVRSPSQRRNRSPLSRRSSSRSPGRRKSPLHRTSRSPVSRRSPSRRNRSPLLRRSLSPHFRRSRSHSPPRRSRSPLCRSSRSPLSRRSRSPLNRRSRSPLPRRSLTPLRRNRSPVSRRSQTPSFRRSRSFSPSSRRNESCSPCLTEGLIRERDHKDSHYVKNIPLPLVESNWETAVRSRELDTELSSSSIPSPLVCLKRSIADSTISDSELLSSRKAPQNAFYPENHELYYKQNMLVPKDSRDDSHSPSPMFSPKRISLDDRIKMELGGKLKSPPPSLPQQQQVQVYQHNEYPSQYPCYYAEQGEKQLPYGVQTQDESCYLQQQPPLQPPHFPLVSNRRPPLLPVPAHVKADMSQWCSVQAQLSEQIHSEASYGVQQVYHVPQVNPAPDMVQGPSTITITQPPPSVAANSHVVQVGNFLQVVPAELPADTMNLIAAPPPPPPPLPVKASPQAAAQKPQHTIVLQTGNVLQVIPSEHTAATPPLPPARSSQKVVQVGNVLEVVPSTMAQVASPKMSPAKPVVVPPAVVTNLRQQPALSPKSLISLPLPPLPLSAYSSPPSPFLRGESAELPQVPSPCGEAAQLSSTAEVELRREQKEKRRQEKERRRLEKEKKKRNKLKLATGNIIKKALQQDCNLLDDTHEVDVEDMKLIEEAIVKVAELEDEEQPLSPAPKKKKKKKKRAPVEFKPLPAAGKGILVFPGFSKEKPPAAEDSVERKTVKFADGVRPGEGTSPSAGEDLPSPPPPPRKLPKEKHFKKKKKKKKIKVKIIRQINMDDDDDDDDDDISPPPPPPGSPPPPPVYPPGYPAFPTPGFIYSQAPQFTVLTTEPVTTTGTAAPVYAPLYHQHHHTTTTTHTTTVQFAAPPPPPPAPPRKAK